MSCYKNNSTEKTTFKNCTGFTNKKQNTYYCKKYFSLSDQTEVKSSGWNSAKSTELDVKTKNS